MLAARTTSAINSDRCESRSSRDALQGDNGQVLLATVEVISNVNLRRAYRAPGPTVSRTASHAASDDASSDTAGSAPGVSVQRFSVQVDANRAAERQVAKHRWNHPGSAASP